MKHRLKKHSEATNAFERAPAGENTANEKTYVLRLYITGMTPRSTAAFESIKSICEKHLQGHYDLEVIDIYQQPVLARDEQIIAAPTLVRKLPAPRRWLVGNLYQEERVLIGLGLHPGI